MEQNTSAGSTRVGNPWVILLVLSLPLFIGSIDLTIISAILPEIINQLKLPLSTEFDEASWAVGGYLLAYTVSMTFTGRLSDLLGRRYIYIICLLIFMFGSWFVTIAHTWPTDWYLDVYRWIYPDPDKYIPPDESTRQLNMIILGRVIQALGAGAMVPVTMALVSDMFPPQRRARPLGVVGAIDTSGWVLGHLYGGAMVKFLGSNGQAFVNFFDSLGITIDYPDWRVLFLINIPLSLVSMVVAFVALRGPEYHKRRSGRFDIAGAVLITLALTALSIGLGGVSPESAARAESFEELARQSQNTADLTLPLLSLAGLAFMGFILWELRTSHPLIDLQLFRKRNYSVGAFNNFCAGFSLAIGLVSVPLIVNIRSDSTSAEAFQDAALTAGLVLSGLTVPMALAALPGGWLSDRYGYRAVTGAGMLIATLGFIFCSATWEGDTSYWVMTGQIAIVGIGLGLTFSPISTAVINEAHEDDRGVSAALILIMRLVGMTVAVSGLTSYAVYRVNERADAYGDSLTRSKALFEATIAQVNEMFLIGAGVAVLAFLASLRMQGGQAHPSQNAPALIPVRPEQEMASPAA